jgi:ribosome-associated protein
MEERIRVREGLSIPVEELEFRVSRASGPGGQGVNTTDSRVELRFDVASSSSLSQTQRARLLQRLRGRVDTHGVLRVVAQAHRSQLRNRQAAIERFQELLAEALRPRRPRIPTAPSAAARARRQALKRQQSARKQARRPPPVDPD